MESVTLVHEGFGNVGGVLNAFRHHGIGHAKELVIEHIIWPCSTPSGIMESVTFTVTSMARRVMSAQRLPASWNRSLACILSRAHKCLVLNAFRHHGIGHSVAPAQSNRKE